MFMERGSRVLTLIVFCIIHALTCREIEYINNGLGGCSFMVNECSFSFSVITNLKGFQKALFLRKV